MSGLGRGAGGREGGKHVVCDTVHATELLHAHHPACEDHTAQVLGRTRCEDQPEIGLFRSTLQLNDFVNLVKIHIHRFIDTDVKSLQRFAGLIVAAFSDKPSIEDRLSVRFVLGEKRKPLA